MCPLLLNGCSARLDAPLSAARAAIAPASTVTRMMAHFMARPPLAVQYAASRAQVPGICGDLRAANVIICGLRSRPQTELYRKLPSVDDLLREAAVAALVAHVGRNAVADAARAV